MAFLLDLHHIVQCRNQLRIGLSERLHIHNAPLGGLRRLDGRRMELLGILLQKLVRHIRHFPLGLRRLVRMLYPQGDNHLIFPERNRVHDGRLDFFRHHRIRILHKPDLRSCLKRDLPGQLKIVQLLLKAVAVFFSKRLQ